MKREAKAAAAIIRENADTRESTVRRCENESDSWRDRRRELSGARQAGGSRRLLINPRQSVGRSGVTRLREPGRKAERRGTERLSEQSTAERLDSPAADECSAPISGLISFRAGCVQ